MLFSRARNVSQTIFASTAIKLDGSATVASSHKETLNQECVRLMASCSNYCDSIREELDFAKDIMASTEKQLKITQSLILQQGTEGKQFNFLEKAERQANILNGKIDTMKFTTHMLGGVYSQVGKLPSYLNTTGRPEKKELLELFESILKTIYIALLNQKQASDDYFVEARKKFMKTFTNVWETFQMHKSEVSALAAGCSIFGGAMPVLLETCSKANTSTSSNRAVLSALGSVGGALFGLVAGLMFFYNSQASAEAANQEASSLAEDISQFSVILENGDEEAIAEWKLKVTSSLLNIQERCKLIKDTFVRECLICWNPLHSDDDPSNKAHYAVKLKSCGCVYGSDCLQQYLEQEYQNREKRFSEQQEELGIRCAQCQRFIYSNEQMAEMLNSV